MASKHSPLKSKIASREKKATMVRLSCRTSTLKGFYLEDTRNIGKIN